MAPIEPAPVAPTPDEPVKRTAVSRGVLRIAAKVWLALLIVGSLQPARPGIVAGLHGEIHYVAFAGAALLLLSLSRTRRREILGAFAIFLLGFSLELLQHLVYRSGLEWRDVADDGLAVLLAFALYRLAGAWKPRPATVAPRNYDTAGQVILSDCGKALSYVCGSERSRAH
jgi:hypothetical protein